MYTQYHAGPPLKPTLTFNQSTDPPMVCYNTYSFYDIISYEINITDFVNDQLVNRETENVSKGCISLTEALYPPQCSPYHISVKAFNRVGASPEQIINAGNNYFFTHVIALL